MAAMIISRQGASAHLGRLVGREAARGGRRAMSSMLTLEEEYPGTPSTSPSPLPAPVTESSTLPNGVRVVSRETGDKVACVGVVVDAGARDEAPREAGASLLLQHLAFKSTAARSSLKLNRDLELASVWPSCVAGREQTAFVAECLPSSADLALGAMAETVLLPNLHPWEVKDAKEKIASSELKGLPMDGPALLTDALHAAAFGHEGPLSTPFLAPCGLSAEDLALFRAKRYAAPAMTVVGVGLSHSDLSGLAGEAFAGAAGSDALATRPAAAYTGGNARTGAKTALTHVAVVLQAAGSGDPDAPAFVVLGSMLRARLMAGAPGAGALSFTYGDTGLLGVAAAVEPGAAGAVAEAAAATLKGLAGGPASAAELAAAVAAANIDTLAALETPKGAAVALAAGGGAVGLEGVTAAQVKAAAGRLLKSAPAVAAVGGDLSAVPRAEAVAKFLK